MKITPQSSRITSRVSPVSTHSPNTARVLTLRTRPRITLDDLAPDFDVAYELQYHNDSYTGEERFSMYSFPSSIQYCLESLARQVPSKPKPSLRSTVSCCVYGGLHDLRAHHGVKTLTRLRQAFLDRVQTTVDMQDLTMIFEMLCSFKISVPDIAASGTRKQFNTQLPKDLLNILNATATDLGVPAAELAKLAIVRTLADQPQVHDGYREAFQTTTDTVLRMCVRRCGALKGILSTMKVDMPSVSIEDEDE